MVIALRVTPLHLFSLLLLADTGRTILVVWVCVCVRSKAFSKQYNRIFTIQTHTHTQPGWFYLCLLAREGKTSGEG